MPAPLPALLPLPGVGRPLEYERAARVAQLRALGESWGSIHKTLDKECKLDLTKDAYRNLYKAYKSGVRKAPPRSLERVFLQWAEQLPWASLVESARALGIEIPMRVPKRSGRPRQDEIRFEGRRMRQEGRSWSTIARRLNAKYERDSSAKSYAQLCGTNPIPEPSRELDLNLIRGEYSS
jgi:hypothetical protein